MFGMLSTVRDDSVAADRKQHLISERAVVIVCQTEHVQREPGGVLRGRQLLHTAASLESRSVSVCSATCCLPLLQFVIVSFIHHVSASIHFIHASSLPGLYADAVLCCCRLLWVLSFAFIYKVRRVEVLASSFGLSQPAPLLDHIRLLFAPVFEFWYSHIFPIFPSGFSILNLEQHPLRKTSEKLASSDNNRTHFPDNKFKVEVA